VSFGCGDRPKSIIAILHVMGSGGKYILNCTEKKVLTVPIEIAGEEVIHYYFVLFCRFWFTRLRKYITEGIANHP
jgi:hypothetical protein